MILRKIREKRDLYSFARPCDNKKTLCKKRGIVTKKGRRKFVFSFLFCLLGKYFLKRENC